MILLVGYYGERDAARAGELLECLRRNCDNAWIDEIHVFLEDGSDPDLAHPKLQRVAHGRRLTFRDAFAYAGEQLRGKRVILANTDIYFDRSLARLDGYPLDNRLLCLSRWDLQADGTSIYFDFAHSQDAWIFSPPLRPFACDWHLGIPGCDNRLTWEAARAGVEVSNPSRSIRAHHLHLSSVRNYTERQRLPGPVLPVSGTYLGAPWLWFVVGGGNDDAVERTAASVGEQPRSELVRAASAADGDAMLCFVAPGTELLPGFADAVLAQLGERTFTTTEDGSMLACSKVGFDQAGGLDELVDGSDAVGDLIEVFRVLGGTEGRIPARLVRGAPASAGADERTRAVNRGYSRAKLAVMRETRRPLSLSARREICRAVERRWLTDRGLVPDAPVANVTFKERMGYSVARLEPGTSSHNNDARPFAAIPPSLVGKPFTQVVASRVSPVEVEFRTPGKLYVLVGTDWHGYYPATGFLREHGFREPLADVATRRGTAFEVWSLLGEAGESLVLPTQVMLVAGELSQP